MSEEIKDSIYAFAGGTIEDFGFAKNGGMWARILVKRTAQDGREFVTRLTAWDITNAVISKGDRIKVSGFLSVKGELYTDRNQVTQAGVSVSINKTKIESHMFAGAVQQQGSAEPVIEDAWPLVEVPVSAEETPF